MKKYTTKAVIYLKDSINIKYPVCYLEQTVYEDDTFEYVFKPYYNVIGLLKTDLFQGIPGLDLALNKESYIRKNRIPTFIYERTPQKNREDLWDLLDEVGLDYLDHLEWLILSDKRYTGDFLQVERYVTPRCLNEVIDVTYGDIIELDDIEFISKDNFKMLKYFMMVIASGATLKSNTFEINDSNRQMLHKLIYTLYYNSVMSRRRSQEKGILKAKEDQTYLGRKKILVSLPLLEEMIRKTEAKEISVNQAMKELGLKSRSTFYRRVKEFKESMFD
jgi:hypothetical protein